MVYLVAIRPRYINAKMPVIPPATRLRVVFEKNSDLSDVPFVISSMRNRRDAIEYLTNPIIIGEVIEVRILMATQLAPQKNIDTISVM